MFFQIVVAFPDDGAWKRFHKLLDHFPTVSLESYLLSFVIFCSLLLYVDLKYTVIDWQVICTKVREGDKRIVRLKEGNPTGCHVVIVDDLVQSGGTLIECQVLIAGTLTYVLFPLVIQSISAVTISSYVPVSGCGRDRWIISYLFSAMMNICDFGTVFIFMHHMDTTLVDVHLK